MLNTKVAILERDTSRILDLLERIDTSIIKLTEVSSSLKEILAVQENRIDTQDNRSSIIERKMEKHEDRITSLENWRWYLTGAIAIASFAIPMLMNILKH